MNGYSGLGVECGPFIEISQEKFYKVEQMTLLWLNIEEIWLTIGFANIDDVLYVNRMSDMNFIKTPVLFMEGSGKFTDTRFNLPAYPLIGNFYKDMEFLVKQDISSLCPTNEAWKVWLQLQNRTDARDYFIRIDKTEEEIKSQKIELIGVK